MYLSRIEAARPWECTCGRHLCSQHHRVRVGGGVCKSVGPGRNHPTPGPYFSLRPLPPLLIHINPTATKPSTMDPSVPHSWRAFRANPTSPDFDNVHPRSLVNPLPKIGYHRSQYPATGSMMRNLRYKRKALTMADVDRDKLTQKLV